MLDQYDVNILYKLIIYELKKYFRVNNLDTFPLMNFFLKKYLKNRWKLANYPHGHGYTGYTLKG